MQAIGPAHQAPNLRRGWSHADQTQRGWSHADQTQHGWSHADQTQHGWSHADQTQRGWSHADQTQRGDTSPGLKEVPADAEQQVIPAVVEIERLHKDLCDQLQPDSFQKSERDIGLRNDLAASPLVSACGGL